MGLSIWRRLLPPRYRYKSSLLEDPNRLTITLDDLIEHYELRGSNFTVKVEPDKPIQATEEFLERKNVSPSGFTIAEERERHRMRSQAVVLWSLVVPMSLIPFALIGLLFLSGSDRLKFDDSTEKALLGAIAVDYFGLYYVITRNLFPADDSHRRSRQLVEDEPP
ncbi:MAG TPA: hypothetical protein V6D06_12470 [Trichocoleus sp.]